MTGLLITDSQAVLIKHTSNFDENHDLHDNG